MARTHDFARPILLALGLTLAGCADAFTYSATETAVGRTYLSEQDFDSAGQIFAEQVRRNPKDYRAYYYLGQSYEGKGRDAEAVRSYRTGLEVMDLTPRGEGDEQFHFMLTDALSGALARVDSDGSQLATIEKASKGDAQKKLLIAMTHAKAGRPDAAMGSFAAATSLDRDDPVIAKQHGLYLESLKQDEAARQTLTRAYRLDSADAEVAGALRRLGVVPGPSLLSKNDLARPAVPIGPLPEVQFGGEEQGRDPNAPAAQPAAATQTPDGAFPVERP